MRSGFFFLVLLLLLLPGSVLNAGPLKIFDSRGNKVELKSEPCRIIITGRAGFMISNIAFLFKSASEKLFSYGLSSQFGDSDEFYRLLDPSFATRPASNDRNTGVEELAAMQPDLILAREVERTRLERQLQQLDIPVIFFDLENPKTFFEEISIMGQIFVEPERAVQVVDFFKKWQSKIASRLEILPKNSKKPRVLHLFHSEREGPVSFSISPAHWIQARLVRNAGGEAVWVGAGDAQGWKKVGFEQIAAWKPDFILITSYFGNVEKAVAQLKEDPLWQKLDAVKKGHLYAFPEDYVCWDQPDTRWILGQCWMAAAINPQISELKNDLRQLKQEFFQMYFLTSEQIEKLPVHGDAFEF